MSNLKGRPLLPEKGSIKKYSLRKNAFSNILEILLPKNENFQIKNSDSLHISAQNIDYGYSLEPPRRGIYNLCFNKISKNNEYPCKPQFYYIKWGLRGSKVYRRVFVMVPMGAKSFLLK